MRHVSKHVTTDMHVARDQNICDQIHVLRLDFTFSEELLLLVKPTIDFIVCLLKSNYIACSEEVKSDAYDVADLIFHEKVISFL